LPREFHGKRFDASRTEAKQFQVKPEIAMMAGFIAEVALLRIEETKNVILSECMDLELVTRNEIGTDMPIAVMPKAELFIDLAQPRPRSFAIQAQITTAKSAGAFDSPAEQGG